MSYLGTALKRRLYPTVLCYHGCVARRADVLTFRESLADVNPYSSRAITDFYAYDSYVHVRAGYVYQSRPSVRQGNRFERMLNGGYSQGVFSPEYQSGVGPEQFGRVSEWGGQDSGHQQLGRDGLHWVGDLIFEADLRAALRSWLQCDSNWMYEGGNLYFCSIQRL